MSKRRAGLIIWSAALILVLVAAIRLGQGGYLGELISRIGEPGSPVQVHDLANISSLQEAFNRDAGTPRLVLLVSPT